MSATNKAWSLLCLRSLKQLFTWILLFSSLQKTFTAGNVSKNESRTALFDEDLDENIEDPNERGIFDFLFNLSCNSCKCGVPNRQARFLGGEYLRSHEFPWMVSIHHHVDNIILGTLISDRYVLTAATPLLGLTPYDIKVSIGVFDRCFPEPHSRNVSTELIIIHHDYNPGNRAHDIALVKLGSSVKFNRDITPICLPLFGSDYVGQVGTISSWYESDSNPNTFPVRSCRPRKLLLPIVSRAACAGTIVDPGSLSLDKGCLGVLGQSSPVCAADAGGSVLYRGYNNHYDIIGVLSDKNMCSILSHSAMFTKISDHLNWIIDRTRDSCFCYKSN